MGVLLLVALFFAIVFKVPSALQRTRVALQEFLEDIVDSIAPNAAREFAYGVRHFNAQDPAEYDIDRASRFFDEAALRDPNIPYLYHELARVAFLQGDFATALGFIDTQINMHGDSEPSSYYVRGLIEGYMGNYASAAVDYQHFLQFDPHDWAAINDYAWVLLKAGRAQDADIATTQGLLEFPGNPWLLNTNSIALYEIGDLSAAYTQAEAAVKAGETITQPQWLRAYPGNDPAVAAEGIAAFQKAALDNMHSIALALASSTVQSR